MEDAFEMLVKKLGDALYTIVTAEFKTSWDRVTLDVRYDGNGGFWLKARVDASDQDIRSMNSNTAIDLILIELDNHRVQVGSEWFGFVLTMTPSMRCTLDLNYDPFCVEDDDFFDD